MENIGRKAGIFLFLVISVAVAFLNLPIIPVAAPTASFTREFNSQSYDGYMAASDATYATARDSTSETPIASGTTFIIGQNYPVVYTIYRVYVYFDSSIIPNDATITSAKLRLYLDSDITTDDFNITIQNGQPTYPTIPLTGSDFNRIYYSGDGGQINTTTLGAGYNNITVSSTGLTWISQTGTTKLCLRDSKDIGNTAPTTDEYAVFYAAEKGAGYLPILEVTYTATTYTYNLQGAFNEQGTRSTVSGGAINVTIFRETEAPETVELDGSYEFEAETSNTVMEFDLGYNESRFYYLYQTYEEIYVIRPDDPYYIYYFTILDYAGLEWGYLESMINMNGTDRVVERQTINIVNNIPFTFTWGTSYTMRLVCNLGSYVYGDYVAGATSSFTVSVTSDMFPIARTDIGDLTVSAIRMNYSWIQVIYFDSNSTTNWVNFTFYEYGNSTFFFSYNTTSNSVTYNWYDGISTMDYYVIIEADHSTLGTKYWTFTCPAPTTGYGNPFTEGLSLLGDFPFELDQLPAVLIIVTIMLVFSWWNAPMGIIATVLVAFILAWIGWFDVGWIWLTTSGSIAFILALAMKKDRET